MLIILFISIKVWSSTEMTGEDTMKVTKTGDKRETVE